MPCQVPKLSSELVIGIEIDDPTREALVCETLQIMKISDLPSDADTHESLQEPNYSAVKDFQVL